MANNSNGSGPSIINDGGKSDAAPAINGGLDSLSIYDDEEVEEAGTLDSLPIYDDEEDEEAGTCIHGNGDRFVSWLFEHMKEITEYYSMERERILASGPILYTTKAIPVDESNNGDADDVAG
ncbi:hypothetical protein KSP39_PZI006738 [Platanthera zijinensis]|uniref:Uncharacterized protein n=1 Tax=Platanthera zijinensis TaxID=2320716 RepID=A0AAP0BQB3_9ASPA